jgi:hypothetical protein
MYSKLKLANHHRPMSNTIISNVPGPPIDLYCAGALVTGIFPMGPVMEGIGVNVTVLSEARHLNVGVMACPDLVPDVEEIGAGFVAAIDELLALARKAPKQGAKQPGQVGRQSAAGKSAQPARRPAKQPAPGH